MLQAEGGCPLQSVLVANTVAVPVVPVTTPEMDAENESSFGFNGSDGLMKSGDA